MRPIQILGNDQAADASRGCANYGSNFRCSNPSNPDLHPCVPQVPVHHFPQDKCQHVEIVGSDRYRRTRLVGHLAQFGQVRVAVRSPIVFPKTVQIHPAHLNDETAGPRGTEAQHFETSTEATLEEVRCKREQRGISLDAPDGRQDKVRSTGAVIRISRRGRRRYSIAIAVTIVMSPPSMIENAVSMTLRATAGGFLYSYHLMLSPANAFTR